MFEKSVVGYQTVGVSNRNSFNLTESEGMRVNLSNYEEQLPFTSPLVVCEYSCLLVRLIHAVHNIMTLLYFSS